VAEVYVREARVGDYAFTSSGEKTAGHVICLLFFHLTLFD
jgi:hypothetical protein